MSSILKSVPKVHWKVSLFLSYFLENSDFYVFLSTLNFSQKSFTYLLDPSSIYKVWFITMSYETPHFCLFVLQVSLVQFLIENCLRIFGEDITSLLGENSMSCDNSEKAAGTMNNLIAFSEKQTARLPGVMGDA